MTTQRIRGIVFAAFVCILLNFVFTFVFGFVCLTNTHSQEAQCMESVNYLSVIIALLLFLIYLFAIIKKPKN